MRKKSEEYFHVKPENFNCAQAVLKGFQKEFGINDQTIEEFRAWGGGRAQDGICGALFTAEYLLGEEEKALLRDEFKAEMGTISCRELKQNKKACVACVRLADNLVQNRVEER